MNDEADFLRALQEDPTDDTARRAYADWLEERGDVRAEYLRLRLSPQWPELHARIVELENHIEGEMGPAWVTLVGKGERFGDRRRFAVEIDEIYEPASGNRRVDIWAGGHWLTCDCHWVSLDTFRGNVELSLRRLRRRQALPLPFPGASPEETHRRLRDAAQEAPSTFPDEGDELRWQWQLSQQYRELDWGPTTDNLRAFLFRREGHLLLTFEFRWEKHRNRDERGVIFVAELPEAELTAVLRRVVKALGAKRPPGGRRGPASTGI
jgi:uncharacterized protein (TIGR02996 family)